MTLWFSYSLSPISISLLGDFFNFQSFHQIFFLVKKFKFYVFSIFILATCSFFMIHSYLPKGIFCCCHSFCSFVCLFVYCPSALSPLSLYLHCLWFSFSVYLLQCLSFSVEAVLKCLVSFLYLSSMFRKETQKLIMHRQGLRTCGFTVQWVGWDLPFFVEGPSNVSSSKSFWLSCWISPREELSNLPPGKFKFSCQYLGSGLTV